MQIKSSQSKKEHGIRWTFFIGGMMIMSFGVALMIQANLGSAPWDVLHLGLNLQFGLTVGTWAILVGLFILAISGWLIRKWPKIGVLVNMVLMGLFIDFFIWLVPSATNVFLKIIMLIFGILIIGLGNGLYIAPGLGAGPRDSLMIALDIRTGWGIRRTRGIMEIGVLALGWLLGGPVFIGTLLFSVGIGYVVGFTLPKCQRLVEYMVERGKRYENINERALRSHHHDGISKEVR